MTNLIETPERAAVRLEAPLSGETAGNDPAGPPKARGPWRPQTRRLLLLAGLASALVHLLFLWAVRVPAPGRPPAATEVRVDFEPVVPARPETAPPPGAPAAESRQPDPRVAERPAPVVDTPEVPIARPRPSEGAPEIRTIPPTTLLAPLTPLEGTPGGIERRSSPADARRTAIARAESLLASRLADLPGAGVPREPSVGLAEDGGVTVPIPWGGFVPENRVDRVWREERCAGKDADEADKAGEGEARRSQCD